MIEPINIDEAIKLLNKCKNMLKASESENLELELSVVDGILKQIKSLQDKSKKSSNNQKEKLNEIEMLLSAGEFVRVIQEYNIIFPENIFVDNIIFLEYWIHLTLEEKTTLSLVELKIAYYLLTNNFDSRQKVKKDELLARIDDLVSIRKRREELNKNSM